jgi:mRNA interferase RelE/StbE
MYNIEFVTSAAKEFRSLEYQIKHRVAEAIDNLKVNPRPRGVIKLHGQDNLYRISVGIYRVVYEINDHLKIIRITKIRHRREAYR